MPLDIFHQLHVPKGLTLPDRFTFPFSYSPHAIARIASKDLQENLIPPLGGLHDFEGTETSLGKMFGVLIVKDVNQQVGYLAAFSGKLRDTTIAEGFVPPIYDRHNTGGFFMEDEKELDSLTAKLKELQGSEVYISANRDLENFLNQKESELKALREKIKAGKIRRKLIREQAIEKLSDSKYSQLELKLIKESQDDQFQYKRCAKAWKKTIERAKEKTDDFEDQISQLKNQRKRKSSEVQKKLFEKYQFLNAKSETKSLFEIFRQWTSELPPAGAGDCAAPKLLQYAFDNGLTPIAMAEFWWGVSPPGQVRKHGHFYPACRSKCEPILSHMLKGLDLDGNPVDVIDSKSREIETIYEDEALVVIVKPEGLLSVPGKKETDSVLSRMKVAYPHAAGPLVVHRLDLSTSGLMVITKTEEAHKNVQKQFIDRTIKKRYVAVLNGRIPEEEGVIKLPLRVDLDNRPQQMVCQEFGKEAETHWKVLERAGGCTRIQFTPITGRTHQLRVHAAHPKGLNVAILGDDLYGEPRDRLYLHAAFLEFKHPVSMEVLAFESTLPF